MLEQTDEEHLYDVDKQGFVIVYVNLKILERLVYSDHFKKHFGSISAESYAFDITKISACEISASAFVSAFR